MSDIIQLVVTIGDDTRHHRFVGRFAWTLAALVEAGEKGITSYENPAPRIAHYVFRLRRDGVPISTITEGHGGAYAGSHARYVLDVPVAILSVVRAGDRVSGRAA